MVISILPPSVKSADCATAFEVGDMLLVDMRPFPGSQPKQTVVTVEKVTVSTYALSGGRTYRSVLYGLSHQNQRRYTVVTEHDLQRRFLSYVWER